MTADVFYIVPTVPAGDSGSKPKWLAEAPKDNVYSLRCWSDLVESNLMEIELTREEFLYLKSALAQHRHLEPTKSIREISNEQGMPEIDVYRKLRKNRNALFVLPMSRLPESADHIRVPESAAHNLTIQ